LPTASRCCANWATRPTGELLPFEALVAIHWAHRLFAWWVVARPAAAVGLLQRRARPGTLGPGLLALLTAAAVLATGLSNVVLQWPIVAALLHSAGAAALVLLLTLLLARSAPATAPVVQTAGPPRRLA
jgi:cytochrome c oxidase assembly protein subunit 15